MKVTLFIVATVLIAFPALLAPAKESDTYGDMVGVVYRSNYDGDTIRFDISGIHPLFGNNIPIRLRGVDTPEIRGTCPEEKRLGITARDLVRRIFGTI